MDKKEILGRTKFTGKLIFGNEVLQSFAEEKTLQFYFEDAAYLVERLEHYMDDNSVKAMIKYIEGIADEPESFQDFICDHPICVVCVSGSQFYGFHSDAAAKRATRNEKSLSDWKERSVRSLFTEAEAYTKQLEDNLNDWEEKFNEFRKIQRGLKVVTSPDE